VFLCTDPVALSTMTTVQTSDPVLVTDKEVKTICQTLARYLQQVMKPNSIMNTTQTLMLDHTQAKATEQYIPFVNALLARADDRGVKGFYSKDNVIYKFPHLTDEQVQAFGMWIETRTQTPKKPNDEASQEKQDEYKMKLTSRANILRTKMTGAYREFRGIAISLIRESLDNKLANNLASSLTYVQGLDQYPALLFEKLKNNLQTNAT
jgi:hypothetical protein